MQQSPLYQVVFWGFFKVLWSTSILGQSVAYSSTGMVLLPDTGCPGTVPMAKFFICLNCCVMVSSGLTQISNSSFAHLSKWAC